MCPVSTNSRYIWCMLGTPLCMSHFTGGSMPSPKMNAKRQHCTSLWHLKWIQTSQHFPARQNNMESVSSHSAVKKNSHYGQEENNWNKMFQRLSKKCTVVTPRNGRLAMASRWYRGLCESVRWLSANNCRLICGRRMRPLESTVVPRNGLTVNTKKTGLVVPTSFLEVEAQLV